MNYSLLKHFLIGLAIVSTLPLAQAQFDDVYYDADTDFHQYFRSENSGSNHNAPNDDVTYYDNDEYEYYDYNNDDYYYSSCIRRFYHPYVGFSYYNPIYTGCNYYDPYGWDSYYPGFSISFGFGFSFGWGNPYWNNYYYPYYGYNYYGGCNGYPYYGYGYNTCYNSYPPYGNSCGNHGDYHDYYYGPRHSGNTGSSPRGRVTEPGLASPVFKDVNGISLPSLEKQPNQVETFTPIKPSTPIGNPERSSQDAFASVDNDVQEIIKTIPFDKELKKEDVNSSPKRPVFKPYEEKTQSEPGTIRSSPLNNTPPSDNSRYRPYTPESKPSSSGENVTPNLNDRPSFKPSSDEPKPNYNPAVRERGNAQLPDYNPPSRNEELKSYSSPSGQVDPERSNNSRPSYSPPPRQHDSERSGDRPGYSPPRNSDSDRSSDKPSYSPSPRNDSPRSSSNGSGNSYSPSRSSSSGGSNHSSGSSNSSGGSRSSGGSSGGSSPRGRG